MSHEWSDLPANPEQCLLLAQCGRSRTGKWIFCETRTSEVNVRNYILAPENQTFCSRPASVIPLCAHLRRPELQSPIPKADIRSALAA
jgi:hypothetical protein